MWGCHQEEAWLTQPAHTRACLLGDGGELALDMPPGMSTPESLGDPWELKVGPVSFSILPLPQEALALAGVGSWACSTWRPSWVLISKTVL